MKKPIISLGRRHDVIKLFFSLALILSVCILFFLPEESVAVFGGGNTSEPKSLYGLIKYFIQR